MYILYIYDRHTFNTCANYKEGEVFSAIPEIPTFLFIQSFKSEDHPKYIGSDEHETPGIIQETNQ